MSNIPMLSWFNLRKKSDIRKLAVFVIAGLFLFTSALTVSAKVINLGVPADDIYVQGNLGVGTSAPSADLEVLGEGKFSSGVRIGTQFISNGVYSYSNGMLLTTDIGVDDNTMIELYIEGNSYSGWGNIAGRVQTYNYVTTGTFINSYYVAHGIAPTEVRVFHQDGVVKFWMPQISSYQTFRFRLGTSVGSFSFRITGMANAVMPTTGVTNEVVMTPKTVLNNNVGIGMSNPTTKLDVTGTFRNTLSTTHSLLGGAGNAVVMSDNTGALYSTELSTFLSSNTLWSGTRNGNIWNGDAGVGNVGIGTTNPESLLHLTATSGVIGALKIEGGKAVVTTVGEINSRLDFGSNDTSVNNTGNIGGSIVSVTEYNNGADVGLGFYTFTQSRTPNLEEAVRITAGGNVGIGKTNPEAKLHVSEGSNSILNLVPTIFADAGTKEYPAEFTGNGDISGILITNQKTDGSGYPFFQFYNYFLDDSWITRMLSDDSYSIAEGWSPAIDRFVIKSGGNVGIGTTNPGAPLQIGNSASQNILLNQDARTLTDFRWAADARIRLTTNAYDTFGSNYTTSYGDPGIRIGQSGTGYSYIIGGVNLLLNPVSGNVGIGTTDPGYKLEVYDTGSYIYATSTEVLPTQVIYKRNNSGLANEHASLRFLTTSDGGLNHSAGQISLIQPTSGNTASNLAFKLRDNYGSFREVMRVDYNGNLGIGTDSPEAKLHISEGTNSIINLVPTMFADAGTKQYAAEFTGNGDISGILITNQKTDGSGYPFIQLYNKTLDSAWVTRMLPSDAYSIAEGLYPDTAIDRLVVTAGGNVGIGTTTPGFELDVNGSLRTRSAHHTMLGGAGNIILATDNEGTLYTTDLSMDSLALNMNTGIIRKYREYNDVNGTAGDRDYIIRFTNLTTNRALYLLDSLCVAGRTYVVSNDENATNSLMIWPQSPTTINGQASLPVGTSESVTVYCDGSNWVAY